MPRAATATVVLGVVSLCLLACEEPARPWSAAPSERVIQEGEPFLPSSSAPSLLADAGFLDRQDGGPEEARPRPRTPGGGLWAGCHQGFRASGDPVADVARLSALCGPANGMQQQTSLTTGEARPRKPARHALEVARGHCYRLFVAADHAAGSIEVAVGRASGEPVARDHGQEGWSVVDRERPFCAYAASTFEVVVALESRGRYALELWSLAGPP